MPQHRFSSQGSSSNASYTYLTPPETLPTPSGTMVDTCPSGSQTNFEGLNVPLGDPPGPGMAWLMDVDLDAWQDIVPVVDHSSTSDANPGMTVETQHTWAAANIMHTSGQDGYPIHAHENRSNGVHLDSHFVPKGNGTCSNQSYYHDQSQRVYDHLAAFDEAYQYTAAPEQRVPTYILASDRPRHFPGMNDTAAMPWSAWIASQQVNGTDQVSEVLYEPAADFVMSRPTNPSPGLSGDRAEEFDHDVPMDTDPSSEGLPIPENNIDPPPPPDPIGPPSELAHGDGCRVGKAPKSKSSGGRRRGPLNVQSRQNARTTRLNGPCWGCTLQRNQCKFEHDGDEMCIGCKKKLKQSLLPDCIRIRLPDLAQIFIPASLAEQHDPEKLKAFAKKRVRRYLNNHMTVYLTWGFFRPIKCDVTEIESVGGSLVFQNQFRLNLSTNRYDLVEVPSPPLGMTLMAVSTWRLKFDDYLEELLRTSFGRFPEVCFRGDDCRVAKDFLVPIFEYHEAATGRARKLVHQCLKLVVLTHMMTHQLTLVESTKDNVYERLNNPPTERYGHHTSPRWLSRQIKFLLSTLHQEVMRNGVLYLVQDTLRRADRKPLWAALFASMIVLAMTTETQELTVRCKEKTDKGEGTIRLDDRAADDAINLMDERFQLMRNLFHQGYRTLSTKGFNPLQSPQDRAFLDEASQSLAAKANMIVEDNYDFLVARQVLQAPSSPRNPQTGRLLAQFLLCFSPPEAQHQNQPAVPVSSQNTTDYKEHKTL